jgi:UDP-glucuronate 4-epimerase|tara:strand:+ start:12078 stop:13046 length:969 start_codon:yes stop_codon:yes gene_type:complete
MKILITGCAGFIGYHVAKKILNRSKLYQVFGIDNVNSYYSRDLKIKRVLDLKKNSKFKFLKIDISNRGRIDNFFKKHKFEIVIHMAAQAGVRYSFVNPESYIESNIKGFFNIIENSNKYKVKKFIFASSSSVYGEQKKYPFKENFLLKPNNIYSFSKKLNEDCAKDLSKVTSMKIVGLRFFTIYGKFGRPDMFIFKFLKSSFRNLKFELNNNGNHNRDFTHIDDVTDIINKLINKTIKDRYQIFNVCSNNPSSLLLLISKMKKILNIDTKIVKISRNVADVLMTHGDNRKIKKYLKIKKFRNIFSEIKNVIDWYKKNKIYKY